MRTAQCAAACFPTGHLQNNTKTKQLKQTIRHNQTMKITEVTVTAGRTFNHPHETYSNLRPDVTLKACLDADDDPNIAAKALQARAEWLVEDHKQGLLTSIEELYQLSQRQAEVRALQRELQRAQDRLEEIRNQHPEVGQMLLDAPKEPAREETSF